MRKITSVRKRRKRLSRKIVQELRIRRQREDRKNMFLAMRQEGYYLAEIGAHYNITKQAVYNFIGRSKRNKALNKHKRRYIEEHIDETDEQLASHLDTSLRQVRQAKKEARPSERARAYDFVVNSLESHGFTVEHGKNCLFVNDKHLRIHYAKKNKGAYRFTLFASLEVNTDFFALVCDNDIYIIPAKDLSYGQIHISKSRKTKYTKYMNNYDLLT